jgi:hypothetical protein
MVPEFVLKFHAACCKVNDKIVLCLAWICRSHNFKVRGYGYAQVTNENYCLEYQRVNMLYKLFFQA